MEALLTPLIGNSFLTLLLDFMWKSEGETKNFEVLLQDWEGKEGTQHSSHTPSPISSILSFKTQCPDFQLPAFLSSLLVPCDLQRSSYS